MNNISTSALNYSYFNDSYIEQDFKKKLFKIIDTFLIIYSIFIVIFGTIFNLINFACFYKMKKRNSQNLYLGALSLADLFNIQVNILIPLSKRILAMFSSEKIQTSSINEMNPRFISKLLCILNGYFVEVGLFLPVWIMVILATERFISIMRPFNLNAFGTRKKAKKIIAILVIVILIWSSYKFATAGIESQSTFLISQEQGCRSIEYPILVNFSTIMWSIVPEILTLILNLFIINQIKITTNPHKKFYSTSHCKKITQATRVVILLSIMFICLISPTGILIILNLILNITYDINTSINGKNEIIDPKYLEKYMNLLIARKVVLILYETNLVINFPIYLITMKNYKNISSKFKLFDRQDSTKIGMKKNPTLKNSKNFENIATDCNNLKRNSQKVDNKYFSKPLLTDKRDCPEFIEFQNIMKNLKENKNLEFSSSNSNEPKSLSISNKHKKSSICSSSGFCENWLKTDVLCPVCSKISNHPMNYNKVLMHKTEEKQGNNKCLNLRRASHFNNFIPNVLAYEKYKDFDIQKSDTSKSIVIVSKRPPRYSRKRSLFENTLSNLILENDINLIEKEKKSHRIYYKNDALNFL